MDNPRQIFLDETLEKVPKIQVAIDILAEEPGNKTCINIIHVFFHTVYCTGSTIGYGEAVEPAKTIENTLSSLLETGQSVEADLLKKLKETVSSLKEKLNLMKTAEESSLPDEQERSQTEMPRHEILFVDDDAALRKLVTEELSKRNFGVAAAGDAVEAKKSWNITGLT